MGNILCRNRKNSPKFFNNQILTKDKKLQSDKSNLENISHTTEVHTTKQVNGKEKDGWQTEKLIVASTQNSKILNTELSECSKISAKDETSDACAETAARDEIPTCSKTLRKEEQPTCSKTLIAEEFPTCSKMLQDDKPPVPPPRKKRKQRLNQSQEAHSSKQIKNGFTEVFANDNDTSSTADTQNNIEDNENELSTNSPQKTTLTRKVSKVGNKKSDKFFGENLSDCLSDESYTPGDEAPKETELKQHYHIEEIISKQTKNDTEKSNDEVIDALDVGVTDENLLRSINKEKGKLMFSFEKHIKINSNNEEEMYKGEIPVQEEIIIPVQKHHKHICDEDDHLHDLIHSHDLPVAPMKPQREFSKLKKSFDEMQIIVNESKRESSPGRELRATHENEFSKRNAEITEQAKMAIEDILRSAQKAVEQQNNEMEKIDQRNDKEGTVENKLNDHEVASLINDDIKKPDKDELIKKELQTDIPNRPTRTSEVIPPNLSNSEKILRRCLSTQSYLTSDLIEKIALQANMLSMPGDFAPEDTSHINDGSALVSPSYKLEQKRSLNTQISNSSDNNRDEPNDKYQTSNNEKSDENGMNISVTKKVIVNQNIDDDFMDTFSNQQKNFPDLEKRTNKNVSESIKNFLEKEDLKPKEILELLQYEFGDCIFSPCLPADDKIIVDNLIKSIEENQDDDDNSLSDVIKSLTKENNKLKSAEKRKVSKIPIKNKNLENVEISNSNRRHSIDDLNSWFSPEKDLQLRKRKREASLPGCLDNPNDNNNHREQQSDSDDLTKKADQITEENVEKSSQMMVNVNQKLNKHKTRHEKQTNHNNNHTKKTDHSTLLQFIEHEKSNN